MEDRFECRKQEVIDPHTGATLTFGRHENGHAWMRIAVSNPANPGIAPVTRTTTVVFDGGGSVMLFIPHNADTEAHFDLPPALSFNELTAGLQNIPVPTPVDESKQAKENDFPEPPARKHSTSHAGHGRK